MINININIINIYSKNMDFFKKLFKKKKKEVNPRETINTLSKLKSTCSILEKRKNHLENKIKNFVIEAKIRIKKKDKRGALILMRRKKMYQKEISKLDGSIMNLEKQIINIESMSTNKIIYDNMKNTKNYMKKINVSMNIDNVENTMEDLTECMDTANEINDVISQPIGDQYDEDELMGELEDNMEEELLNEPELSNKVLSNNKIEDNSLLNLPDPPYGEISINNDSKEKEKDSDLLNLENLMTT